MGRENEYSQFYASWEVARAEEAKRLEDLKKFARQNPELGDHFRGVLGDRENRSAEDVAQAEKYFELSREMSIAVVNGIELVVSPVERGMLEILDSNRNQPLRAFALGEAVWGPKGANRPRNYDTSSIWRPLNQLKGKLNEQGEVLKNVGGKTHSARWVLEEGTTLEFREVTSQ